MTSRVSLAACLACGSCFGALLLAGQAAAQVPCDDLPNPIYLQVGDTQEPLMKALGRALRDEAEPVSIVYVTSGSCTNIEAIYTGVPISTNALYVPSTAEDTAWTTKDPSVQCTIAEAGHAVDVANSALFVSSCNPDNPPAGVKLFQGPVQAYGFVVPETSTQKAITAEEAYFVFGFGSQGKVTPWDDEAALFIRPVTKSTLLTMAATIAVPAEKWKGERLDKSSEVMSALVASPKAEKALGILGAELYDKNRDKVNLLAFRAYNQKYAYFPDSTSTAFDKQNVRDGHYVPWSPTVWLTKVDAQGKPTNATAKLIIDLILGLETERAVAFEPLDTVIGVGLVPECAMRVTRSVEAGELSLYEPEEPCGCYYDSKVSGKAPAACKACDTDTPCASGTCRHGFCEAR